MSERERLLQQIAARHADVPRRVIRRLAGGRVVPVDDLAQATWIRVVAETREPPLEPENQGALVARYAEWTYRNWQRYSLQEKRDERRTDSISALAERRTGGEAVPDSDDAVIGLVGIGSTVEQVVLLREQLGVVRAAVALMTPALRLGLAHLLGHSSGRPDHAPAARRRLVAALAAAGYAEERQVVPS